MRNVFRIMFYKISFPLWGRWRPPVKMLCSYFWRVLCLSMWLCTTMLTWVDQAEAFLKGGRMTSLWCNKYFDVVCLFLFKNSSTLCAIASWQVSTPLQYWKEPPRQCLSGFAVYCVVLHLPISLYYTEHADQPDRMVYNSFNWTYLFPAIWNVTLLESNL